MKEACNFSSNVVRSGLQLLEPVLRYGQLKTTGNSFEFSLPVSYSIPRDPDFNPPRWSIGHHASLLVPKYWPRSPFGVWPCLFLEAPKTRSENHSLALLSAFLTAIWGGMDTKVVVECLSVKANQRMITSHFL